MNRNPMTLSQVRSLTFLRNYVADLVASVAKVADAKSRMVYKKFETKGPVDDPASTSYVGQLTKKFTLTTRSDLKEDDFVREQESDFERALAEWNGSKTVAQVSLAPKPKPSTFVSTTSNYKLEVRSRELVQHLKTAIGSESQLLILEDVCQHLMQHPQAKGIMVREKMINIVLRLREWSGDASIQTQAREALALLGYSDPCTGSGVRILSIDGGGTRGMVAIEVLRHLEAATGRRVAQLFDFVCGVSTGAILAMLLGGLQSTLDECEELYRKMSREIFSRSSWIGTGHLFWSHAYYDTIMWETMLRKNLGESLLIETARKQAMPKLAAVSALMNQPTLQAFVFRNYSLPYLSPSQYPGSNREKIWQAVRASAAAPGYFEEFCLNDNVHQDGGIMLNNPTALAIHEAKLLWPREAVSCVVSLGNGRYVPPTEKPSTPTSLKTKVLKILDSATDTEGVHWTVHDLLPPNLYFRLNPYLTEPITLDENRPEKLEQLKLDAQMYVRRNQSKLKHAAQALTQGRSHWQRLRDCLRLQSTLRQHY